jgi:spermidine/putrescine transport system permease protein
MGEVFRAFGLRLGALIWLLVGVWVIGLVAAPFAGLVARSLVTTATRPVEAGVELRHLTDDLAATRRDWERATDPERRAELDRRIRLLGERARRSRHPEGEPTVEPSLANLAELAGAPGRALLATAALALLTTALTLVVCWPVAWAAALASRGARVSLLLVALVLPYGLLEPSRLHAWDLLLGRVGLGGGPASPWSMLPAMIHTGAILMILPIFAALARFDRRLIETARDLGASHARIHTRIVLPQAAPGLAVGAAATFLFSFGSFAVPWITSRGRGTDDFALLLWRRITETAGEGPAAAYAVTAAVAGLLGAVLLLRLFGVRPCDFALRRCRS